MRSAGAFADAKEAERTAHAELCTAEYLTCWESHCDYVLERLPSSSDPIVDVASGRCYVVERMTGKLNRPIIVTDFSPRVLRRSQRFLEFLEIYDRICLLAFDVRRTPFKNGAVKTMTTNLGFADIENPARRLNELQRVISGELLAIVAFYPEDDKLNNAVIEKLGLAPFMFKDAALERFAEAGFTVELENTQKGRALPTPTSDLLGGAGIAALPVAETELEWCTLVAR